MTHLLRNRVLSASLGLLLCLAILCGPLSGGLSLPCAQASEPILSGGPSVESKGAVVMEVHSGAVLYAKNATEGLSPTSLTKLMTGLLALENVSLTDTVSCSYKSIHSIGSSVTRVGLEQDERMSVGDILHAIMVASADEATYALGEKVGGSMSAFITMMNERMTELGGLNTEFTSATGTGGVKQTSCAYDMGLVACEIGRYSTFLKMAGLKWYELPETNLNDARVIAQTHKFIRQTLTYDYAKAGKTGGKDPSGYYSLCTYAEKDGMLLVAIVMGSPSETSAYDDSVTILNYAFENYETFSMKEIQGELSDDYTGLFDDCPMFSQNSVELVYTDEGSTVVLPLGADLTELTKTVEYFDVPEYVHGENVIGQVAYRYQGKLVGRSHIIFYNQEFPMSQAEFNAVWPKFLLPPSILVSQGGTGALPEQSVPETKPTGAPSDEPNEQLPEDKQPADSSNRTALIVSIVLFVLSFLVCLTVIYVVIPYRQLKKNRRRRRI